MGTLGARLRTTTRVAGQRACRLSPRAEPLFLPGPDRMAWRSPRQHTSASSSAPHSSARLTVVLTSQPCAPGTCERRGQRPWDRVRPWTAFVGGSRAAGGWGHRLHRHAHAPRPAAPQPCPTPLLLSGMLRAHAHPQKRRTSVHVRCWAAACMHDAPVRGGGGDNSRLCSVRAAAC